MKLIRPTIFSLLLLTILTGVIYPVVITGVAKAIFPHQADGSLIDKNGFPTHDASVAIGSSLIGQTFDQPRYFWSRPSATTPQPYNAAASSGSNIGPSAIAEVVKARIAVLRQADKDAGAINTASVPIDLVTASGSGLDPHESIAAADYQVPRIARIRHIDPAKLEALIAKHTQDRSLGIFGEKVVNVLELNLDLDKTAPWSPSAATLR